MKPSRITIYGVERDQQTEIASMCIGEWHVHSQVIWIRGKPQISSGKYAVSHRSGMAVRGYDDYDDACALARRLAELPPCPVDDKAARAMSYRRRSRSRAYTQWLIQARATARAYDEEHDDVSADI